MSLLDAPAYDEAREKRRRKFIIITVVVVLIIAALGWHFRHFRQEREVSSFFTALEQKDYAKAYGIYYNDPNWKQHPEKYPNYPFKDFYRDWGPGGEWGVIHSYKVDASGSPKGGGSGVIVQVVVNDRAEHARIWVQKSDKTLSFSPY